jgi:hypothetical protein
MPLLACTAVAGIIRGRTVRPEPNSRLLHFSDFGYAQLFDDANRFEH